MTQGTPPLSPADIAALMTRIRDKSSRIVAQQALADAGEFKSYGGALGLQTLRKERRELQGRLPPLALVA